MDALLEALTPSSSTVLAAVTLVALAEVLLGAFARRLGSFLSWTITVAGTVAMHVATLDESPLFRMVAVILGLLWGMKAVVLAASREALPFGRWLLFCVTWFGMRPESFAGPRRPDREAARGHLVQGALRFLVGLGLVWSARVLDRGEVAWSSLGLLCVGLSLMLHFGLFRMLCGMHRAIGFRVQPLFKAPLLSVTLKEFWGRRWNVGFSEMTATGVYRPISSRFGRRVGVVCGFLFSGLLHELAISVPVQTGYGGPLLYFALHGIAMLLERRFEIRSRIWVVVWMLVPLPLLFHEPFLRGVLGPLLQ